MSASRNASVGSALQDKMIGAKISTEQLARVLEMDADRLRAVERGAASMDINELCAFSNFFECPIDDFFIGLYDFRKHVGDFPEQPSHEQLEQYLLTYFRKIRMPTLKKLMCTLVRQTAEMDEK